MVWAKRKLFEIGEIISGATPRTSDSSYYGGDIAWITPADLSGYSQKYISHGERNITRKGYDSCATRLMPKGTVLFSSRAPIGYVAIASNDICTNQGFKSIVPHQNIDSEFLYYQLIYLRETIRDMGSGTTFKEISGKKLGQVEVVVPPLPEQRRIVSRIEELFSELDNSVSMLQKTNTLLGVYRQAVLKEAFAVEKHRIVELGSIVDDIKIGPFGTMLHKSDYITGGVPIVNPQHIKNNIIVPGENFTISEKKAEELNSYRLRSNDLVMGRRGEMGRVAPVTEKEAGWICGTGSIIFRLRPEFDAIFYAQILSSPDVVRYLEKHATGTTMKNLNDAIVKHIPVPFITKAAQKTISEDTDYKLSVCDNIEQTVDAALRKAEAMRQSILKQAFEGRL